jgi:hypothetical protein
MAYPSRPISLIIGTRPVETIQYSFGLGKLVSAVELEKNLGDPNDPIDRENAALDRMVKGICRGC